LRPLGQIVVKSFLDFGDDRQSLLLPLLVVRCELDHVKATLCRLKEVPQRPIFCGNDLLSRLP
jgi:hypothetical protein